MVLASAAAVYQVLALLLLLVAPVQVLLQLLCRSLLLQVQLLIATLKPAQLLLLLDRDKNMTVEKLKQSARHARDIYTIVPQWHNAYCHCCCDHCCYQQKAAYL
jgi:hypothetical protein